jgi:hypothetical protein
MPEKLSVIPIELQRDRYWKPVIYLFSKNQKLKRFFTTEYFDLKVRAIATAKIKRQSAPWSQSERFMLSLALHLFNGKHKVDLADMDYLDEENSAMALEAIKLRYC